MPLPQANSSDQVCYQIARLSMVDRDNGMCGPCTEAEWTCAELCFFWSLAIAWKKNTEKLEPGVMSYTFNPTMWNQITVSFRQAWST